MQNTALFPSIIQRLIINNNQLFNIRQQEYYCVIDELKWAIICAQNIRLSLQHKCGFAWVIYDIQLLKHYLASVVIELNRVYE